MTAQKPAPILSVIHPLLPWTSSNFAASMHHDNMVCGRRLDDPARLEKRAKCLYRARRRTATAHGGEQRTTYGRVTSVSLICSARKLSRTTASPSPAGVLNWQAR